MWYLANPCTPQVREAMEAGLIGLIDTPKQRNRPPALVIPGRHAWGADTGIYGEGYPGDDEWFSWLSGHPLPRSTCLFATAPDVVGDAAATLERSAPWLGPVRGLGYLAAFVAQNGQEDLPVPWDLLDVLFLGGSPECKPCGYVRPALPEFRKQTHCPQCQHCLTEWKTSAAARRLTRQANALGKWVHMGRVNSLIRIQHAHRIECRSTDGTYLKHGPDKNLPKLAIWMAAMQQGLLDLDLA